MHHRILGNIRWIGHFDNKPEGPRNTGC